jgi:hypothetical protein
MSSWYSGPGELLPRRVASDTPISAERWPACVGPIELVWHRLNRRHDLARFFGSDVRWAECDARVSPSGSIVVSHTAGTEGDRRFDHWLAEVAAAGRSAKIDLKEGGPVLDGVIEIAGRTPIPHEDLWFNCAQETIGGARGFRAVAEALPGARMSVPVDTLAAWILEAPEAAMELLDRVRAAGVDHLSISVGTQMFERVVRIASEHGWSTNVWDVRTPAQWHDAVASAPSALTADLGVLDPALADPNELIPR